MDSNYRFAFEELRVYQKAMDFGELVDKLTAEFPQRELYALSSQYRRAADSIALNIAEGYPGSDAQFVRHINHALYSSNECIAANTKALRRSYVSFEQSENIRSEVTDIQKMLTSLRTKIRERMQNK